MPKKNKKNNLASQTSVPETENFNVEAFEDEFLEADDFYVEDENNAEPYDIEMSDDELSEADDAEMASEHEADYVSKKSKKIKKTKEPKPCKQKKEPDNSEKTNEADELSTAYLVRLAATLTLICVSVAFLLAIVNNITKDIIAENKIKEVRDAIMSVFPDCDSASEFVTDDGETVYIAVKNDVIIGYCVKSAGSGYNGDVETLISFDTDGCVSGIKIVSMSETPGVGTKVKSESFLEQFFGFDREVSLGEDVDGISGATFSSRAVTEAVNYAISLEVDLDVAANSIGVAYIGEEGKVSDKGDANIDNGDEEINIGEAGEEGEIPEIEPVETETESESASETEYQPVIETETQPIVYLPETEVETDPPMVIEPYIPPAPETEAETEPEPETEAETEPIVETEPETEETVNHIEWEPAWDSEPETSDKDETESETSDKEETESETSDKEETESETSDKEETESETSDKEETESETSDKEETESEKSDKDETESSSRPSSSGGGRLPGGGIG